MENANTQTSYSKMHIKNSDSKQKQLQMWAYAALMRSGAWKYAQTLCIFNLFHNHDRFICSSTKLLFKSHWYWVLTWPIWKIFSNWFLPLTFCIYIISNYSYGSPKCSHVRDACGLLNAAFTSTLRRLFISWCLFIVARCVCR